MEESSLAALNAVSHADSSIMNAFALASKRASANPNKTARTHAAWAAQLSCLIWTEQAFQGCSGSLASPPI
jgi:hypothetical protein